jgi:hypothetical protein
VFDSRSTFQLLHSAYFTEGVQVLPMLHAMYSGDASIVVAAFTLSCIIAFQVHRIIMHAVCHMWQVGLNCKSWLLTSKPIKRPGTQNKGSIEHTARSLWSASSSALGMVTSSADRATADAPHARDLSNRFICAFSCATSSALSASLFCTNSSSRSVLPCLQPCPGKGL